jgi:D-xylose transport system permease protein
MLQQSDSRGAPHGGRLLSPGLIPALELDLRLIGMLAALGLTWVVLSILSGGLFLTPRNLWTLSVQASAIAVLACGMVVVLIPRNIDLSVGSQVGLIGVAMASAQINLIAPTFGQAAPFNWLLQLLFGIGLGGIIGLLQGGIVTYLKIPAFIVTLGGLLIWRGLAWAVASGETLPVQDPIFRMIGGGPTGSIGATASWALTIVAAVGLLVWRNLTRRRRVRRGAATRPAWADQTLSGLGAVALLGAAWMFNSYYLPAPLARAYALSHGLATGSAASVPSISFGFPVPVLIAVGIAVIMTFVLKATSFGRHIFAIGGNPEAAALAGINIHRINIAVFMLMGALAAISAAIATARLNSATNAEGTNYELFAVAAAVIGGTSLSGGSGTIIGALLGALLMQSLQSGMIMLGMDAPYQNVAVGVVLIAAVFFDVVYRQRLGKEA